MGSDSLSGALQIVERYPGANRDALVSLARTAFLDGQAAARSIGAGVCIATALLVALLFPSRTSQEETGRSLRVIVFRQTGAMHTGEPAG
jgi:hypothetical protein